MLHDSLIAIIRTAVPTAVGALVVALADFGVVIGEDASAQLIAAVVAIVTAAYYAAVTYLEREVNPAFGWLLGAPKAPHYAPATDGLPGEADPIPAEPDLEGHTMADPHDLAETLPEDTL